MELLIPTDPTCPTDLIDPIDPNPASLHFASFPSIVDTTASRFLNRHVMNARLAPFAG